MSFEINPSNCSPLNGGRSFDRDAIAEIFAEIALEAAVAVMAVYALRL